MELTREAYSLFWSEASEISVEGFAQAESPVTLTKTI